jgi:branched-chain amino acid transport system permease protein
VPAAPHRWAAAAAALLAAYLLPGSGPWLDRRAPVGIVVTGVILGTVTGLLAAGLVLVWRANRFVNFAYGAMGSLVGVLAIGLHLEHGWPFFAVLPLAVAAGALLGAAVELVVIRRFSGASRLVVTVASIGLAQLLGGLELLGSKAIGFVSLTGGFEIPLHVRVDLGVKTLLGDEVLILAAVPPVLAGLAWFLLRTDAGVAIRAAAENAERALTLGIPVRRLTTLAWSVAGALAALTFILQAPFRGVTPGVATNGATVLLPPLAAAIVAGMSSLPLAFAAGVAIGVMQQVVQWNTSGTPSFQYVVLLVAVLAALLARRRPVARAGGETASSWSVVGTLRPLPEHLRRLPEVRVGRAALGIGLAVAFVVVPRTWTASDQFLAAVAIVWAIVAVSLVVLTGWGGHISLGQFAIVGVGATVAGNLAARVGLDLFLALAAAGVAGAAVALVVGLPALRIRGLFLAATTLALAVALDAYVLNRDNFPSIMPTGLRRPVLWSRIDLADEYAMYLLCLGFFAAAVAVAAALRGARAGRVVVAVRDNDRAADAAAVPTTRVRLGAFVAAGAMAGVAGGLHVLILSGIDVGTYSPALSLDVFTTAVIGGLGSVPGAVAGVLLFRWLDTVTALGDVRLLLYGTGLLVVLWALPGGLSAVALAGRDRLVAVAARRRGLGAQEGTPGGPPGGLPGVPAEPASPSEEAVLAGALAGVGRAGRAE